MVDQKHQLCDIIVQAFFNGDHHRSLTKQTKEMNETKSLTLKRTVSTISSKLQQQILCDFCGQKVLIC